MKNERETKYKFIKNHSKLLDIGSCPGGWAQVTSKIIKSGKILTIDIEKMEEVKNVTLFRDKNTAEFPDAVTSRGSKHLLTLIDAIKKGYKSYLLFLVQIQNMEKFKIAKDVDAEYYKNYLIAKKAGVNFLAYRCDISSKKIFIDKKLKIIDD